MILPAKATLASSSCQVLPHFCAGVPNPEDSAHKGDGVAMDYDPKLDVKPSERKPAKSKSAVGSAAHAAEVEEGRAIKVHCRV